MDIPLILYRCKSPIMTISMQYNLLKIDVVDSKMTLNEMNTICMYFFPVSFLQDTSYKYDSNFVFEYLIVCNSFPVAIETLQPLLNTSYSTIKKLGCLHYTVQQRLYYFRTSDFFILMELDCEFNGTTLLLLLILFYCSHLAYTCIVYDIICYS